MILSRLLEKTVRVGHLEVIDATGKRHVFSGAPGPQATIRLHKRSLHHKLYLGPELYVGEAYMDGTLTIEKGSLTSLLDIMAANQQYAMSDPVHAALARLSQFFRGWQQYNPIRRSRAHVAHHYDLPDRLYDLFLDADRQYSCAYFKNPDDDLETAQRNKLRHIAAKLLLEPGQRVLDIGSGWGGLALHLANEWGGEVTGLTLSSEQLKIAKQRARDTGLADQVDFQLRDYREQTGTFDRIVSVGMFEHVGVNHYPEFFSTVNKLLADDGVCLLHSIGRMSGPSATCAWIRKYIFPGGYSPSMSETLAAIEKSGLWVTDIEVLRLHYADTLHIWRQRFEANREAIAELMDERFCRMWEFYLALSEAAFRHGDHFVFQIQIAKRRDAVPLTRDYIAGWENAQATKAVSQSSRRAA